jgi:hypothetical protein
MRVIRLLPIAFLFTGVFTFLDRGLNDEISRLASIREDLTSAISSSKARLSEVSWTAISDAQWQQNFEQGNINTVAQSLQGYIRPGEVSQMDLVDGDCTLIARVPQNGKPISELCQFIKAGKSALFWQQNEQKDAVVVALTKRELGGKPVFMATQLVYDQAWASLHVEVAGLLARRDVAITETGSGAILWREGRLQDGRYALPIKVDGWIYRLMPELTGIGLVPIRESFWVLYGALGLVIGVAMFQEANKKRQDEGERRILEAWVHEHNLTKLPGLIPDQALPPTWTEIVQTAKAMIAAKDEQRSQQLCLVRERLEGVTGRLREREVEMSGLEDKIAGMSDLASLQDQLQHTTASFLRQMHQLRDLCENVHDVAGSGLSHQAKELEVFCARWKEGLSQGKNREMAARKFFRSLVETPGSMPGWSKLDDDMRELGQLTSSMLDQSLHAEMLSSQAIHHCDGASKLASLWHGIAMRDRKEKTSEWLSCLSSAQKLITADDRFQGLTFENLPQISNPEQMYPAVTGSALVSGFFHLYLSLLQDADLGNVTLPMVIRQKRFKDQASIILSLPAKLIGQIPESPSEKMFYHVDLATQILAGCGVKVSVLPPTTAGYPVGLTWSLPQNQTVIIVDKSPAESFLTENQELNRTV